MEAQNATMTEVESITELLEGDTVTVRGNGLDLTTEVGTIGLDEWKGMMAATLEPADGMTYTLTDTDHPLQSDGITANVGSVTVFRHDD